MLAAATDDVVARVLAGVDLDAAPRKALRAVALGLFDAIDAHPVPSVPGHALFDAAGALVNYVLGVAGQNAANARALADRKADRPAFLTTVAAQWSRPDPGRYPFVHKAAKQLPGHDDREQFLAGVDIVLVGIATLR